MLLHVFACLVQTDVLEFICKEICFDSGVQLGSSWSYHL